MKATALSIAIVLLAACSSKPAATTTPTPTAKSEPAPPPTKTEPAPPPVKTDPAPPPVKTDPAPPPEVDANVAKVKTFADSMCACKDRPCRTKLNTEFMAWVKSVKNTKLDKMRTKTVTGHVTRLTRCLAGLPPTPSKSELARRKFVDDTAALMTAVFNAAMTAGNDCKKMGVSLKAVTKTHAATIARARKMNDKKQLQNTMMRVMSKVDMSVGTKAIKAMQACKSHPDVEKVMKQMMGRN